jgi:hypothetical protein
LASIAIAPGKRKELYSAASSNLAEFGKISVTDFVRDFWKDIFHLKSAAFSWVLLESFLFRSRNGGVRPKTAEQ